MPIASSSSPRSTLCGGVKKRAADMLGISLKTLYNRLEEYGHAKEAPGAGADSADEGAGSGETLYG